MDPHSTAPRGEELLVHGRFLRGLARALVSDPGRAEDLVQDTWTVAIEHGPKGGAVPRAWLAQVLRRLAIKKGLREGERGAREQVARAAGASRPQAHPDTIAAELELSRIVLQGVERLREPYRSTIYLRYYRALSPQDIAADGAVPLKTVKTRLARGLEFLRQDLDRQHGGRRESWVALLLPLAREWPGPISPVAPEASFPLAPVLASVALVVSGLVAGGVWWLSGSSVSPIEPAARVSAPLERPKEGAPALRKSLADRRSASSSEGPSRSSTPASWRMRGQVLDPAGAPLLGAEVRLELLGGGTDGSLSNGTRGRQWLGRNPRRAWGTDSPDVFAEARERTDPQGEFELELGATGLAHLTVELDGFAPYGLRLPVFVGQDLDLGGIVLDPGVFLAGRITGPDGIVVGAEIWQERTEEGLTHLPDASRMVPVARSDENGLFQIRRQASGPWKLEVRAGNHVPRLATGSISYPGERVEGLELLLERGTSLQGRVIGHDPASGRRLAVLGRGVGSPPVAEARLRRAELDEEGGFLINGLGADEELELVLVDEEDGRSLLTPPQRARAGELGVRLLLEAGTPPFSTGPSEPEPNTASGSVLVSVRDRDGSPSVGALVARRMGEERRPGVVQEVRAADSEGGVSWEGLPEGEHEFRVVEGVFGLEGQAEDWARVRVSDETEHPLELASAPSAELAGSVFLAGRPLANARLFLRPSNRSYPSTRAALALRSDALGRFGFKGLPLGSYRILVSHPERALPEVRDIELRTGVNELDLELSDARLDGVVLDRSGVGLAGAWVCALPERSGPEVGPGAGVSRGRAAGVQTAADGSFTLRGLSLQAPVRVAIALEGYATQQVLASPPRLLQDIVLEPEALLHIELFSQQGAYVVLRARGPGGLEHTQGLRADSRTTIRGLAQGVWELELERRERRRAPQGEALARQGGAPARQGEALALKTIELSSEAPTELRWYVP